VFGFFSSSKGGSESLSECVIEQCLGNGKVMEYSSLSPLYFCAFKVWDGCVYPDAVMIVTKYSFCLLIFLVCIQLCCTSVDSFPSQGEGELHLPGNQKENCTTEAKS